MKVINFIRDYIWVLPLCIGIYFFTINVVDWFRITNLIEIQHSKGDPAWELDSEMWDKVTLIWASLISFPIAQIFLLFRTTNNKQH